MYSTCIFCHAQLGANESVEHFPVGRRLAFDGARGRLWVVCRHCERWNLSPLEERWEAIEECERLFSGTRMRVSTDNVGLARVGDGLELVRIGAPQRPEMAAWRYGDRFGRRRRKQMALTLASVAAGVGFVAVGPMTGIIAGSSWSLWTITHSVHDIYQQVRVRARLRVPGIGDPVRLRKQQLNKVALIYDRDGAALEVPFVAHPESRGYAIWTRREESARLRGDDLVRAAGQLLPLINKSGARRSEVADAVRVIEDRPDPKTLFSYYADTAVRATPLGKSLSSYPNAVRLALEMAAHEESERRAFEGELALLEAAWKDAEEVAAISDDLFVTDETRARLADLKSDR